MNIWKICVPLAFLLALAAGPETARAAEESSAETAPQDDFTRDWTELDEDQPGLEVWDPLEPVNRGMFWFNDKLYFYLFKPVARGYRVVLPEPARQAVGNVFDNLGAPVRVANSLLQGKLNNGLDEFAKFLSNTVFGLGGMIDLHADTEPQPSDEDFGQTLGHYGLGPGFYLVLPVLGPSNLRDGAAEFADRLVEPMQSPYYLDMHDYEVYGARALDRINWLSLDDDTYESIKQQALDPYLFVRGAYMQRRAAAVEK